jgi:class 3 adenylate cyclase/TolB-like protein
MNEAVVSRRLAAILAADVAGYTRLMAADENATLKAWWRARNEIIDPSIAKFGGRIVKHTGDGFLAEFATATEAVRCAAEMQTALAETNVGAARDKRFDFRMGVNVGEIVDDQEDIYGDGVNIAARLESLADPGGICLSQIAYDQVRNKLDLAFEYLGAKKVKHVAEPLRHYRVRFEGDGAGGLHAALRARRRSLLRGMMKPLRLAAAAAILVAAASFWPSDDPTSSAQPQADPIIVIVPFRTIGEAANKAFSEGLTEDLLTALSSASGLRVIHKDAAFDRSAKAKSLDVSYRFEGSVRWVGDKVRVSAQLVDAKSGFHLWGGRYDREVGDVLKVQNEVAEKIVATLSERLAVAKGERMARPQGAVESMVYRGLENLGRIAEMAAFLPQELFDWVTGGGESDFSVEGLQRRQPLKLANLEYQEWI